MAQSLREGKRNAQIGIERSREMIANIKPIPHASAQAIIGIANMLIASRPNVVESWKVNTAPLSEISMAHRTQWDYRVSSSVFAVMLCCFR
jgi:hypothetical protein